MVSLIMKKTVTILGSTGSIGKSTVSLLLENHDKFEVAALTANGNIEQLSEQAKILNPKIVAISDKSKVAALKELLPHTKILAGEEGLIEAASQKADITICGIVGIAGLKPTMAAIEQGGIIGLANKESMICAGTIMLEAATKSGAKIIPVDSEHNAIFQVFDFKNPDSVEKVILTASGGPFRSWAAADLEKVTPEQAINHPKWKMGAKISVDSATLMNKGLELIEAHYLFGLSSTKLGVVVHPESIIHSMVYYNDGSVLAQAANPDMRVPISGVLGYPNRLKNSTNRLDLTEISQLNFEKPDYNKFPCLKIAMDVLDKGLAYHIALNAANELAVEQFLSKKIKFTQIPQIVETALSGLKSSPINTIADVFKVNQSIRETAVCAA